MTAAEALAAGLLKYGEEWWVEADVTHMVNDLMGDATLERDAVAHVMWAMGAWLEHPKCRNNPKHGNDADYSNGCKPCQKYLLVIADAILEPISGEAAVTLEKVRAYGHQMLEANGMSWCSMHGRSVLNLLGEEVPDAH